MKILLLTPPMTQLNTPYPATAYIKGFLKTIGRESVQKDPALELVLRLFSREGLHQIRDEILARETSAHGTSGPREAHFSAPVRFFLENFDQYATIIDPAIRFLQGKDPTVALKIVKRSFIPEGPFFSKALSELERMGESALDVVFGYLGVQDRARYFASLLIDELAFVIKEGIDPEFSLSRYGEKLAASAPSFDPLLAQLSQEPTLVARELEAITRGYMADVKPDVVALTAPFPGNVLGALRMARTIREVSPHTKILLGGGYPNTELRSLKDPRVFDYFDFITLDDGERPITCLLEHIEGRRELKDCLRTFARVGGRVVFASSPSEHDIPHAKTGTPSYEGLPLDRYLSLVEMLNPMHRLWSDGRWNKLTLAHGCYWKKCNFCDVTLDYIGRYDPAQADLIIDRMLEVMNETGQSGFHFVDEAAPPALLRSLSERLIERGVQATWWGNLRFEKTFTPELARLMAQAGCVAVSGGLEVASDRLLKLMNKGVTVEQVARVTHAFTEAGILVHAYLMYGFPTQTVGETVDALERVRQLFEAGVIHSAFWHRFSATIHSPIGRDPGKFGIELLPRLSPAFAENDLPFHDPSGVDHDALGRSLNKALYNYMHGIGFDYDVREWFKPELGPKVPRADVAPTMVEHAILALHAPSHLAQTTLAGLTRRAGKPAAKARSKRQRR